MTYDPNKLPLSTTFPLADDPYYSRVQPSELDRDLEEGGSKNYKMVAFRPGVALQASELNEIQENFAMQMTLTMNMYHNWITSGVPSYWGSGLDPTITSIGNGGIGDAAISAPGWQGTTPLFPFESPHNVGQFTKLVDVSVSSNASSVNITFRKGWYLGEIRGDDTSEDVTGLKYWIYLNSEDMDNRYTLTNIPLTDANMIYVGFKLSKSHPGASDDEDLFDNSNGLININQSSPGANRLKIELSIANYASGLGDSNEISKVLKINSQDRTIRYMNNLLITSF
jgi:hypothetical protein